jgi:hypothetical protein
MHTVGIKQVCCHRARLAVRRWRVPPFKHEGLRGKTVEFGEPRRDVRKHRLYLVQVEEL